MGVRKTLMTHFLILSISLGLMALGGCGEGQAPTRRSGPTGVLLAGQTSRQIAFLNEVTCKEEWVKGGKRTVKIRLRGHQLVIPKKAVPANMIVLVRMCIPQPGVFLLSLEPGGLTFVPGHPASLSFNYEDADMRGVHPHNLAIYRELEGEEGWECLGGRVNPGEKTVTVDLDHFSRYALASR